MDESRDRVDALTGIRIIAAGLVFLSHVEAPPFLPTPLRTFMEAGYNGVTLFFVLSGFVLAWNYADRMATFNGKAIRQFAVARVARIYPMYLFALVFAASPALLLGGWPPNLWLHIFSVQTWHPDLLVAYAYNAPGWSIGVELFLYACFPFVIIPLYKIRRSTPGLLSVVVLCVVVSMGLALWFSVTGHAGKGPDSAHRWLYRMPLTRLGDFVVGIAAALLVRNRKRPVRWASRAQVAGGVALVALMALPPLIMSAWSFDVTAVVPVFVLLWGLACASDTAVARTLASKALVRAGEASYAFYLLHAPLLGRLNLGSADGWRGWVFEVTLQFAIILLVAIGAHVVIERPAQRWLRHRFGGNPALARVNEG